MFVQPSMALLTRNVGFQTGFSLEPVVEIAAWDSAALLPEMFRVAADVVLGKCRGNSGWGFCFHMGPHWESGGTILRLTPGSPHELPIIERLLFREPFANPKGGAGCP